MKTLQNPPVALRFVLAIVAVWLTLGIGPPVGRAAVVPQAPPSTGALPSSASVRAALTKYCVTCHSQTRRVQGLAFDTMDLDNLAAGAEVWEKAVRKLRTGAMPPSSAPRPDAATYDMVASFLESGLDRAASLKPNPGRLPALHRLNRTEYHNVVRDLLALEHVDVALLLPGDDSSYGFDNIADVLWMSATLLDRYLAAARKISRLAVGDPETPLMAETYRLPVDLAQDSRVEGLPMGTRGGTLIRRDFPLDGEYVTRITLAPGPRFQDPHHLEVSVDGERVQLFTVGGDVAPEGGRGGRGDSPAPPQGRRPPPPRELQVRVPMKAGPRAIAVTFVQKTAAQSEQVLQPFLRPGRGGSGLQPYLASVTITGPYLASGASDTPSRRRLFICRPNGPDATACAKRIIATLARRAYRRPVTDADLQLLMPFYEAGRAEGGVEMGIERTLERVLVSPSFLFRVEHDPTGPGAVGPVTEVELASRLSFFLWSSIPDDQLLDLAVRGKLRAPGVLDQQVQRMLADPRSASMVTNFAAQWLYLRNVAATRPDPRLFPDFDEGLRLAFVRETELFFESVLRENRSVIDLLTADYTFVNERLARHYGMANVYGSHFRRVTLTDPNRRGLLGEGSILTLTSYANRTSPVLRGKWILENVLGAPPPPPPPDVPALKTESETTGKALSMREAMVQHRANAVCAGCHARMDPLGFAMENFDALGSWRTRSGADSVIDASGELPDGTQFDGVAGLRQILLRRPEQFAVTVTEKLLTYALGRGLEYYDAPSIRAINHSAAGANYTFSSLVLGVVKSMPFQMRMKTE